MNSRAWIKKQLAAANHLQEVTDRVMGHPHEISKAFSLYHAWLKYAEASGWNSKVELAKLKRMRAEAHREIGNQKDR